MCRLGALLGCVLLAAAMLPPLPADAHYAAADDDEVAATSKTRAYHHRKPSIGSSSNHGYLASHGLSAAASTYDASRGDSDAYNNKLSTSTTELYSGCPHQHTGPLPYAYDCRRFLNCFNGRGYLQSCAPGTAFNPATLECDRPEKVLCGANVGLLAQKVQQEQPRPQQQRIGRLSNAEPICPTGFSGLHPHPTDCSKYLNCANGMTFVQHCSPGTAYSPKIMSCDYKHKVDCGARAASVETSNQPANPCLPGVYDFLPHPHDRTKYIVCNDQNQSIQSCSTGTTFNSAQRSCIPNETSPWSQHEPEPEHEPLPTVNQPAPNWNASLPSNGDVHCPEYSNGLEAHPFDCHKFLVCTNGHTSVQDCGPGRAWRADLRVCVIEDKETCAQGEAQTQQQPQEQDQAHLAGIICPDRAYGLFAHPFHSAAYIYCENGNTIIQTCAPGLIFSIGRGYCLPAAEAPYAERAPDAMPRNDMQFSYLDCPRSMSESYLYPFDCAKYVSCAGGHVEERACAPGQQFSYARRQCLPSRFVARNERVYTSAEVLAMFEWYSMVVNGQYMLSMLNCPAGLVGQFQFPYDSNKFLSCQPMQEALILDCPMAMVFSISRRRCLPEQEVARDDQCYIEAVGLQCPVNAPNGRFAYASDCFKYLNCENGQARVQICLPGTAWNEQSAACDHQSYGACTIKMSFPTIPANRNPKESSSFDEKPYQDVNRWREMNMQRPSAHGFAELPSQPVWPVEDSIAEPSAPAAGNVFYEQGSLTPTYTEVQQPAELPPLAPLPPATRHTSRQDSSRSIDTGRTTNSWRPIEPPNQWSYGNAFQSTTPMSPTRPTTSRTYTNGHAMPIDLAFPPKHERPAKPKVELQPLPQINYAPTGWNNEEDSVQTPLLESDLSPIVPRILPSYNQQAKTTTKAPAAHYRPGVWYREPMDADDLQRPQYENEHSHADYPNHRRVYSEPTATTPPSPPANTPNYDAYPYLEPPTDSRAYPPTKPTVKPKDSAVLEPHYSPSYAKVAHARDDVRPRVKSTAKPELHDEQEVLEPAAIQSRFDPGNSQYEYDISQDNNQQETVQSPDSADVVAINEALRMLLKPYFNRSGTVEHPEAQKAESHIMSMIRQPIAEAITTTTTTKAPPADVEFIFTDGAAPAGLLKEPKHERRTAHPNQLEHDFDLKHVHPKQHEHSGHKHKHPHTRVFHQQHPDLPNPFEADYDEISNLNVDVVTPASAFGFKQRKLERSPTQDVCQFDCGNGQCAEQKQICDGVNNCGNRKDESDCAHLGYKLRLAGEKSNHMGRLEVKIRDQWGYVCDDKFDMRDAEVVCKELGFKLGAMEVRGNSYYPPAEPTNVTFWMNEVECRGNESSLKDCDFKGWGVHNCNIEEVVGVACKVPVVRCPSNYWSCRRSKQCIPLAFVCDNSLDCRDKSDEDEEICNAPIKYRLAAGRSANEGRLEVRYRNEWGTVCDDDFNIEAAQVACNSLGYYGKASIEKRTFGPGVGPIWLDQIMCVGNESSIDNCTHFAWGEHNCNHTEDVGLRCTAGTPPRTTTARNTYRGDQAEDSDEHEFNTFEDIGLYAGEWERSGKLLSTQPQCGHFRDDLEDEHAHPEQRVINGTIAKRGHHPWQATIRTRGRGGISSHFCGAVLISRLHVLTAAHCLYGYSKDAYFVRMGDHYVNIDEPSEVDSYIENWYVHEKFRHKAHMNNDIALIVLKTPVKFNDYVQPICLPPRGAKLKEQRVCTISGWGSTKSGISTPSHILRSAQLPILPDDTCKQSYVYGAAITDGMFCAGHMDESVDACDGDSGGPLVCSDDVGETLYGIISWGEHCGYANKPGVYVRVEKYVDWIHEKINYSLRKRRAH